MVQIAAVQLVYFRVSSLQPSVNGLKVLVELSPLVRVLQVNRVFLFVLGDDLLVIASQIGDEFGDLFGHLFA